MQMHSSVPVLAACLAIATAVASNDAHAVIPQGAPVAGQHSAADSLRAAHVLSRLTFGSRPGDLERILSIGVDKWIQQQLHPEAINDSIAQTQIAGLAGRRPDQLEGVMFRGTASGSMAKSGDTTYLVRKADNSLATVKSTDSAMVVKLRAAFQLLVTRRMLIDANAIERIARSETSELQLLEVITDFWDNHFSVFGGKMPSRTAIAEFERDAIRPHALGKFRDLLGAVAHSKAMMFYLDNHLSTGDSLHLTLPEYRTFLASGQRALAPRKSGLNENYARELLELHTLGVDAGYTQNDVIEVARAFTGWSISTPVATGEFTFHELWHDADEKVVLGHRMAAGRGTEDGEQVLDILARHPATALFIARKLAVRLVSDSPSEALVARAAETFSRTDGDIRSVVETIVTSPEFFAHDAFRAKVKSPLELVLAMRRALGSTPDPGLATATLIGEMSQPVWGKETPDGWPETGSAWMSAGAMFNRVALAMRVARGDVPEINPDSSATWRDLAGESFDRQLAAVVRIILAGNASPETRDALVSLKPSRVGNSVTPDGRETLQQLIALAFSSPEFQRR